MANRDPSGQHLDWRKFRTAFIAAIDMLDATKRPDYAGFVPKPIRVQWEGVAVEIPADSLPLSNDLAHAVRGVMGDCLDEFLATATRIAALLTLVRSDKQAKWLADALVPDDNRAFHVAIYQVAADLPMDSRKRFSRANFFKEVAIRTDHATMHARNSKTRSGAARRSEKP